MGKSTPAKKSPRKTRSKEVRIVIDIYIHQQPQLQLPAAGKYAGLLKHDAILEAALATKQISYTITGRENATVIYLRIEDQTVTNPPASGSVNVEVAPDNRITVVARATGSEPASLSISANGTSLGNFPFTFNTGGEAQINEIVKLP